MVVLVVAVFADHRFEGSPAWAKEIFSTRAEDLRDLEPWVARLEALAAPADTNTQALAVLQQLRIDLAGATSSRAARRLLDEVDLKLGEASASPDEALGLLVHLLDFTRSDLVVTRRVVPPGYRSPRADDGARGSVTRGSGVVRKRSGAVMYQCSNVTASRTLMEAPCATGGDVWIYDEQWNFTCSTPGHGSNGMVNARGVCWNGPWPRDCPPSLYGPTQSQVEAEQFWKREWEDKRVALSPISSRCVTDPMKQLAKSCPCQEVESPTQEGTNENPPGGNTFEPGGSSPIVIDVDQAGFRFTSLENGVRFDLQPGGGIDSISWTDPTSRDGFLVLDRNGNGLIDDGTELFGNFTPQPPTDAPNGFIALAVFDRADHGGDGDGWITRSDAAFEDLRLWLDRDHDGHSIPDELASLASVGVEEIELAPVESRRRDQYGNELRYSGRVRMVRSTTQAVDVFLLVE